MVTIDQATTADTEELSQLLGEIEKYYGGEHVPGDTEQIRDALFGPRPVATVLLARAGGEVLGLASYSMLWPAAGAETSLYLKELFVRPNARRRGVATALMEALQTAATEAGCSRVEWTADTDNEQARRFYEAFGARTHEGKAFYRVDGS